MYSTLIVLFYRKPFDFVVTTMLPSLRMTQLKISAITYPTCQKALRSDIRARLHCERARGSQLGHYAARQRYWPQWPPAPLGPRHSAVLRWYLSGVISLESTSTDGLPLLFTSRPLVTMNIRRRRRGTPRQHVNHWRGAAGGHLAWGRARRTMCRCRMLRRGA